MGRDDLIGLLLDLLGPADRFDSQRLSALGRAEWDHLNGLGHANWLMPMLHFRHGENPLVPEQTRQDWRAALRQQAAIALNQRAALHHVVGLLEAKGFAPIALKGAWLAWHVYPAPALRPMTDIDLLLDSETILPAFSSLQAAGYVPGKRQELPLADVLRLEKHLPPLIGPHGVSIELHHRLWEPHGRLDHATPPADDCGVAARAIVSDGVRYPAPSDMLTHLIVHAAHSHRLECGPRVLTDLAMLLARESFDWAAFWSRARHQGFAPQARLLLALAERHAGAPIAPLTPDAGPPPSPEILATAQRLLLQDSERHASASALAAALVRGPAGLWQRLRHRRTTSGATPAITAEVEAGWLGSRLRRTLGDLRFPTVWQQSRDLARFSRWIGQ